MTRRGYWDWGYPQAPIAAVLEQDLGELAARLGSPVFYDRQGQVVLMDSFEDGIAPWRASLDGAGAAAALSAVTSRHGRYSFALTAGSDAGLNVSVTRFVAPLQDSPIGIEASFTLNEDGTTTEPTTQSFTLHLEVFDGVTQKRGALRLVLPSGQAQILDENGVYIDVGDTVLYYANSKVWHTMKYVLDLDAGEYSRARINNVAIPVASNAIRTPASAQRPSVHTSLEYVGVSGSNPVCYGDIVLLSQAEKSA